ncbi:unnamed protein product [Ectocarpus sp. 13 AM-2016]
MHRLYRGGGESGEYDGVVKGDMWSDGIREAEEEREGESAMSDSRVGGSSCTLYGCTREPTHGVAGKKAEFCSRHSLAASVNVSKECNVDGCSTRAHYGVAGSKKWEFSQNTRWKGWSTSPTGNTQAMVASRRHILVSQGARRRSSAPSMHSRAWSI